MMTHKTPILHNASISQIFKSSIFKDTTFIFTSKMGTMLLGFAGTIIIVRELGPFNFGLYATATAFIILIAGIFDLGLTTTAIKFGSIYLQKDPQKAVFLFKIIGKQKIVTGLIVSVIGFFMTEIIAVSFYKKPELIYPLKITMVCILLTSLFMYYETIMQTRQQFFKYSVLTIIISLIKLLFIVFLYFALNAVTLKSMLLLQLGITCFTLFLLILYSDNKFIFAKYNSGTRKEITNEVLKFSKWVLISTLCFPLERRLDLVMLNYYVDSSLVGVYACALQLITPLTMLKGSLHNVLLPRVSKITSYNGYKNYASKFTILIVGLCLTFIPVIVFAHPLIELLFGLKYSQSAYIFQILMIKMIFVLVLNPLHMIAYSANHPWIISIKDVLALFINIIFNIILIPLLGISGAAYGTLITTIIGGIIPIIYIYFYIMLPMKNAQVLHNI